MGEGIAESGTPQPQTGDGGGGPGKPLRTYHAVVHVPVIVEIMATDRKSAQQAVLGRAEQQKPVYNYRPVLLTIIDTERKEPEKPHVASLPVKKLILPEHMK
jgi:hypothetical protein